ncbi:prepilin-type N-terminal cleavage/methylation domain-containing protein [Reinekea marinisedimentorum]|uniref:Prepilin-type N-terminal cleavage/methylation domain-containing protein n=1 Tax=Reinekea marinisedimentorum TaxID=230495 RepID=A0A4R3I8J9_9GAMM|nr:prepilin-type N-terminal cleavage/methylation domain-containing protein [Reinekea marinisedimentorum]TCS41642.1 prepilin-type N-terminal cleavage/methylation domain-containing protein [Reinekea marinisedimentorum]
MTGSTLRGFTAIELMVVVVIISVLLVVAIPRLLKVEQQAEVAVLSNTLGSLKSTARIAESKAVAQGVSRDGNVQILGKTVYFHNGFPVARANIIGEGAPGSFSGIVDIMELDGDINVHYSDQTEILSRAFVQGVYLILELNGKCVSYRPPQTDGKLPEYSEGIFTFNEENLTCTP